MGSDTYEDIFDAIQRQISASGRQHKEIAAEVWKGRSMETAKSLLSRSLDPNNPDARLSILHLIAIMDIAGAEHIINMLCDRYFFDRPVKKNRNSIKRNLEEQMAALMKQLTVVQRDVEQLKDGE